MHLGESLAITLQRYIDWKLKKKTIPQEHTTLIIAVHVLNNFKVHFLQPLIQE